MSTQQPTPLPWAVWKLSPDSDPQERHIIITADGEQEITGIVDQEADARHIVRCVNSHDNLLAALSDLIQQLEGIGIPDWHGAEGLCLEQARAAIAEATGRAA